MAALCLMPPQCIHYGALGVARRRGACAVAGRPVPARAPLPHTHTHIRGSELTKTPIHAAFSTVLPTSRLRTGWIAPPVMPCDGVQTMC